MDFYRPKVRFFHLITARVSAVHQLVMRLAGSAALRQQQHRDKSDQ
ncbi:hypothetical protein ACO2Q8_11450 [Larkinella sp. VNQ87]